DNSFASQLKHNLSNSVGLTVSVPIFDNRQNKTNVARARLQRESMELELDARKTQLYSDIEGFWLSAANAQKQYAAAKVSSAAMQESYNLVSEQFEVGLKDIVDVITAKNNLLQADQQLLQSKYTAVLNRAILNFYAGHPLIIN
ncbi:MAG: TolC family protein, partial [Muribaculaceae bacterium]|nr:TolC family protein [Muribaculaceae bacterium]